MSDEEKKASTPESLEEMSKPWQQLDPVGNPVKAWEDMEPVEAGEVEKFNPHHELNGLIEAHGTQNRLSGLATKFALQLAEAREELVLKMDTAAVKALEASVQLVDALQLENIRMHQTIQYFRRWVWSREVADLILRNKTLEQEKAELARQLHTLIEKHK